MNQNEPSYELKKWLEKRQRLQRLREAIRADGGHIMLKSTDMDPRELEEPLRGEAISFLKRVGQWSG
ncbi:MULTISPECIES: hypothetical protein [Rhodanobacter]|uniref:hypothetical protein n=1 Tax=Rhodanobacter TaxID=75309 RepID=UPI0012DD0EC7|nr:MULTISPECIES: hypothetical protein [Rhodanobacter]UJJ51998.1 hypothetical protein LRK52_04710 [Rhodanobacter denitrificans]UJJ59219.1 hypothetical protein LRK55_03535 [Rhodanobacter denitrificans]UJM94742.1 hypothetical protein LRK32_04705 [Rhodanobacter denitrificans]UJM98272.1 hypothetical protein LRK44_04710 [Rhodanobacter denitrificans]UJN22315.1 hypothetical protein LRK54_03785 [Rhodanobacter denitrificans]